MRTTQEPINRRGHQSAEKYILRFRDEGLRERIKALAVSNHRSLNGQLLHLIEIGLRAEAEQNQGVRSDLTTGWAKGGAQ